MKSMNRNTGGSQDLNTASILRKGLAYAISSTQMPSPSSNINEITIITQLHPESTLA